MSFPTVPTPPPAPVRGEDRAVFADKSNALAAYYAPLVSNINTVVEFINLRSSDAGAAQQAATDAAAARDAAQQLANFRGLWSEASGSATVPSSYFDDGAYWALLVPVSDITATKPGVGNPDWAVIATPDTAARLFDDATLAADFVTGRYKKYTGVATGVEQVGFTDVVTLTRGSAATGVGVNAVETVAVDEPRLERDGLLIERTATNAEANPLDPREWLDHNAAFAATGDVSEEWELEALEEGIRLNTRMSVEYPFGNPIVGDKTQVRCVDIKYGGTTPARYVRLGVIREDRAVVIDLLSKTVASQGSSAEVDIIELPDGYLRCVVYISGSDLSGISAGTRLAWGQGFSGTFISPTGQIGSTILYRRAMFELNDGLDQYFFSSFVDGTRANDNAVIPLGADFNPAQGTFYIEFEVLSAPRVAGAAGLYPIFGNNSASQANRALLYYNNRTDQANRFIAQLYEGGLTASVTLPAQSLALGKTYRAAYSYDGSDLIVAVDGVSNSVSAPLGFFGDQIFIGRHDADLFGGRPNLKIHRLYYDPEPWSQAKAAAITGGAA